VAVVEDGAAAIVAEVISERAQRFAREGRHLAAALEYQSLTQVDPTNVEAALRWAYHATRGGQRGPAAEGYLLAGRIYAARGEVDRAVRLAHRAYEVGPARVDRSGVEAIARASGNKLELLLEGAAQEHVKAGRIEAASGLFALLSELGSRDAGMVSGEIRVESADDPAKSATNLREAAQRLRATGRTDEYVRVVETMIARGDCDLDALLEVARIYLRNGDAASAATKLETLRGAAPDRLEAAELLLQAYAALGRTREGLAVLRDIAQRRMHEPLLVNALFDRAAGIASRDADWPCAIRSLADSMQSQAVSDREPLVAPPPPAWGTMASSSPEP
jgi:tetratricopeptide (TPR) repeat protein